MQKENFTSTDTDTMISVLCQLFTELINEH